MVQILQSSLETFNAFLLVIKKGLLLSNKFEKFFYLKRNELKGLRH